MAVEEEERLELFLKTGLDERTARHTIANNKVTNNLTAVIHEVFDFFSFFLTAFTGFMFEGCVGGLECEDSLNFEFLK
jgi:hypothetical protein